MTRPLRRSGFPRYSRATGRKILHSSRLISRTAPACAVFEEDLLKGVIPDGLIWISQGVHVYLRKRKRRASGTWTATATTQRSGETTCGCSRSASSNEENL